MPRSGGGRSSGRSAPRSAPSRPASTSSHVPAKQAAPPQHPAQVPAQYQQPGQRQPGLFANMASTAAGVAVGSSVGHAVSGMLFGGGGRHEEPVVESKAANQPTSYQEGGMYGSQQGVYGAASSCDVPAKDFTKCLQDTNGNMQACSWYLEQLKACQAAASPY